MFINAVHTPYLLALKHTFTIAGFSRVNTPVMLLKLTYEGVDGYGEASMVPYLGESFDSANKYLAKVDWKRIKYPFDFDDITAYLDSLADGNTAVKASIDIALNDINGKLQNKPCHEIYGTTHLKMPVTSYTIGIDEPDVIRTKVQEATGFKVLKVKLGGGNDRELINTIRSVTNVPLYVDANQGWTNKAEAIDLIYWLHQQGVLLIEQPMHKHDMAGNAWLTERSPIPIIADEAVQRLGDIDALKGAYHGINVKLMKCGGLSEGHKMILKARSLNMKVLIGCMSETSCATLAGAALAPLCNWADLDGPWLTANNPFPDPAMLDGRYVLNAKPGLGLGLALKDLFSSP